MVKIEGIYLKNSEVEAITDPSPTQTEGEDLTTRHPPKIRKSIKNYRYAYNNDPTIRGIILNNTTTANNKFRIECKDTKAKAHIEMKVREWDLDGLMTNTLIRVQRDGFCFIEKGIFDNSIKTRFLAYDGEKYKMKIIRNPNTDDIIGYKQNAPQSVDPKGWEKKSYDDLKEEGDSVDSNYQANQIIYPRLIEEGGKGESLLAPILENLDDKKTYEKFMRSAAHKAGNLIGITVGDENTSPKDVPKSFITKLLDVFSRPIEKDVAVVPKGVDVSTIGNSNLPELVGYIKYHKGEIFLALQTPESLFSTESSNRATAEVQADDETGYKVFIVFLRDFLKKYFEKELIDHELTLQGMTKAVGNCFIMFDEGDVVKPLTEADEIPEAGLVDVKTGEDEASASA